MALPPFEKALKIDRNHPMARLGLPRALASLGRMDEAAAFSKRQSIERIAVCQPRTMRLYARTNSLKSRPNSQRS